MDHCWGWEGVQRRCFSEHKNTKHTFPAQKKLESTRPHPNQRRKSKRHPQKRTFPAQKKIFTRVIMTVNRQNCRNEVSLIVGNLAAAIAAKNEREATPHTPGYARTRRRQLWWKCTGISALQLQAGLSHDLWIGLSSPPQAFPWDQSSCESPEKISTEGIAIINFQATSRSQWTNTFVHSFGMCIAILCGGVSIWPHECLWGVTHNNPG